MATEQMTTEQMATELSREQFIEKYGVIKVKFSSYYKFTFVFAARLDNGDYIRVEVGANSDDIYRLEVYADTECTIRNLDPYAGSVWRTGKEVESFYDY